MTAAWQFYLLAFLVGTVQGGSQALSRSLFATMIPRHKSSEFFGFFAVFEKFAGIFGPAVFAVTVALTGSSRNAILSVIAFFVVGALLLSNGGRRGGSARGARAGGDSSGAPHECALVQRDSWNRTRGCVQLPTRPAQPSLLHRHRPRKRVLQRVPVRLRAPRPTSPGRGRRSPAPS